MDMTTGRILDDISRARLQRLAETPGQAVANSVLAAAIDADAGLHHRAADMLCVAIRTKPVFGLTVADGVLDEIAALRRDLAASPRRFTAQGCVVDTCLGTLDAIALGCRMTSLGARLGPLLETLSDLAAARSDVRKAA